MLWKQKKVEQVKGVRFHYLGWSGAASLRAFELRYRADEGVSSVLPGRVIQEVGPAGEKASRYRLKSFPMGFLRCSSQSPREEQGVGIYHSHLQLSKLSLVT